MRKFVSLALCALALLSCKKDINSVIDNPYSVTGDITELTPYSATLTGSSYLNCFVKSYDQGILFSTNPHLTEETGTHYRGKEENGIFSITVGQLTPETVYYYRSYLFYREGLNLQKKEFGEIKSFTTPPINAVVTSGPIFAGLSTVCVKGKVNIEFLDGDVITPSALFLFSETEDNWNMQNLVYIECEVSKDSECTSNSWIFEGIKTHLKERYRFCRAMVRYDGREYFGDVLPIDRVSSELTEGEVIDMGLSVKWRSRNVGAAVPEGSGDYFCWGETSPKEIYSSDYYTYPESEPDVLPLSLDAANYNLGEHWRMPTYEDFAELRDNTLQESCEYKSVNGILLISKINRNTLFFPAAGFMVGSELRYYGYSGFYLSSTVEGPDTHQPYAVSFEHNTSMLFFLDSTIAINFGASVRAVYIE